MNKTNLRIIATGICLLFLASVNLSMQEGYDPVSVTVIPVAPKENEPILVSFTFSNPSQHGTAINYEFYSDGVLVMKGKELLEKHSSKNYKYVYPDHPELGEKITFLLKTESEDGSFEKSISIPAYPPQVMSSFVSFATSMNSEMDYNGSFVDKNNLNVGLILSAVLIFLLIYLELTEPIKEKNHKMLNKLGIRFNRLSAILFIIFIGMVFTKVVMILV